MSLYGSNMILWIVLIWLGLLVVAMVAMVIRSLWLPDRPVTDEEAKEFDELMKNWSKK